jgi:hypothetical protein
MSVSGIPITAIAAASTAIDLDYIYEKTMFYLKQESKFFTSAEVRSIIANDAFKRIAEEIGYPKENHAVVLGSGSWVVSSPTDFIKIDTNIQATYYNGVSITNLKPKEQWEIGRAEVLSATPGIPQYYFMETENKIGINPPATSGQVIIPYVKAPTVMLSGGSTNELSEKCYMAAVYWTVSECLLKDSDERSQAFREMYNNEISRLKSQYNMMFDIRRDLKPHQNYIG